jgi:hypothetical protein
MRDAVSALDWPALTIRGRQDRAKGASATAMTDDCTIERNATG